MRIPPYSPPPKSMEPTLGELRELLKVARKNPREMATGETDADILENLIARREIKAGLRADATTTTEERARHASTVPN